MKALYFEKTGDLANLHCVERPQPVPGPDEVLVQVKAAGVNSSDISNVTGFFPYTTVPRIPGRDFAGIVVQGPAALVGKAVFGTGREIGFTRDGSHAEYLTVPAAGVIEKPAALSFAQAAACGVPYMTALPMIENARVEAGTKLAVIGAAGGVGTATIHLAKQLGAQVLGVVHKPEYAERLRARGFDAIVATDDASFARGLRAHFADGPNVIFDTAGHWLPQSIEALARFGRVAVIVVPSSREGIAPVPLKALYRKGAQIVGVNSLLYSAVESAERINRVIGGFDTGLLRAPDGLVEHRLENGPNVYQTLRKTASSKFVFVT